MKLPSDLHPKRTRRRTLAKVAAPILAFVALVLGMIAPTFIFMLWSGVSLESEFPEGKTWLLSVGCGVGPGLAYLTYRWTLIKLGDFEEHEAERMWNRGRKNT